MTLPTFGVITGLWYIVLGLIAERRVQWVRLVFAPFGNRFKPVWGTAFAWFGAILFVIGFAVILLHATE